LAAAVFRAADFPAAAEVLAAAARAAAGKFSFIDKNT
jgi:hypothetical protein